MIETSWFFFISFSLLSGASDGSWYIHDTFNFTQSMDHTKRCVAQCPSRTTHTRSIATVEWFPNDNGVFTTSGFDGKFCIWDPNRPEQPADKYESEGPIYRHQTNPASGTVIASTSVAVVFCFNL